jgi:hypothetical protein
MKRIVLPPREQIEPDTPLRLNVAAALVFPDGSMTASGLRWEAPRQIGNRLCDRHRTAPARRNNGETVKARSIDHAGEIAHPVLEGKFVTLAI